MKKLLRREGKNREVLECMPSSSHQLPYVYVLLAGTVVRNITACTPSKSV